MTEDGGREGVYHCITSLTACTKKVLIYTMYKNRVVSIRHFFLVFFLLLICVLVSHGCQPMSLLNLY